MQIPIRLFWFVLLALAFVACRPSRAADDPSLTAPPSDHCAYPDHTTEGVFSTKNDDSANPASFRQFCTPAGFRVEIPYAFGSDAYNRSLALYHSGAGLRIDPKTSEIYDLKFPTEVWAFCSSDVTRFTKEGECR